MKLTFGKHKGQEICNIADEDLQYLKWLEEQDWIDKFGIRKEIQHEIERHEGDRPGKGLER